MKIKNKNHTLHLYIQSQSADAAPPLGTILGNLEVNTVNFCKEFNSFTGDLPKYLTLSVELNTYSNRTFKFAIKAPPVGSIINLLMNEFIIKKQGKEIKKQCIKLKDLIQLAIWKFPNLPLKQSLPVIFGVVKSFKAEIII